MIFGLVAVIALIPVVLDDGDDLASRVVETAPSAETLAPDNGAAATPIPPATTADETTVPPTPSPTTTPPTTAPPATTQPAAAPAATDPVPATESDAPSAIASYPTLPDGSPVPVVAIFDVETITLSGFVPSAESAEWLQSLAIANSNFPDAEIVDQLVIDATVPVNVGVRVIELNSPRFPEGSAEVLPEHALELDRAAAVLNALPNVTAIVVGHADQRGESATNYLLSEERAQAVVRYFVTQGITPSRLASRAVGEEDLLTLDNDEAALALNRRTEFVFYGLLAG
jgi:outer membrane protein OmpA-like peptidoglycan-associated protein